MYNLEDEYIYDKEIKERRVICAHCALARVGLTTFSPVHLDLWTKYPSIDGVDAAIVRYLYNPNIDYEYELTPMNTNPLLLLPSKERALVEFIKCEKWCDEGILIESLKTYLNWFYNEKHLYEVAAYFQLPKETLDYWIKEALEDEEI